MFSKIEQISRMAQTVIANELQQYSGRNEYKDLLLLQNTYVRLDELIQSAKDQHATVGSFILSRQLNQSEKELNAARLLSNFLQVLDYPLTTTFNLNQRPEATSHIDTAKLFSFFPLLFMVVMCASNPPGLLVNFVPGLLLLISAIPLAITYACDKPFSMSRFYQEMAGIEKALAYAVFGCMVALIAVLTAPEATMLMLGIAFIGMLATGSALLLHSKHLQTKHESLMASTAQINDTIPRQNGFAENSSLSFFKPGTLRNIGKENGQLRSIVPEHIRSIDQILSGITARP